MSTGIKNCFSCLILSIIVTQISACSLAFGIFLVQSPALESGTSHSLEEGLVQETSAQEDASALSQEQRETQKDQKH